MATAPAEGPLTEKPIRRKIGLSRFLIPLVQRAVPKPKKTRGKELLLPTDAGPVRVLGYNLDGPETLPLFVNMHGGGFILGNAEMDDPFMPKVAETAGVKILNVDYSLAPQQPFPKALNECYGVVKYAKEHPEEFGIDSGNIAVGGQSAGGNLGAAICLLDAERHELGLKALILDYPPLDLHTDPYLKPRPKKAIPPRVARVFDAAYSGSREAAKNPLISPYFATASQLGSFPPTVIISAGQDSLAAEEAVFRDKLVSAGVPVTYKLFEGCRHGFTLKGGPEADEAWQMMIDHLNTHLVRAETLKG
jgi:acetyl esterase